MGRKSKEEGIYVYMEVIDFVVQLKITQHCKATILQLIKKKKKRKAVQFYRRLKIILKLSASQKMVPSPTASALPGNLLCCVLSRSVVSDAL